MNLRWLLLFAACTDVVSMPFVAPDGSDSDGPPLTLHDLSSSDAPTLSGFDLASNPDGPTVTIVSPAAGAEVPYDTLTVTATIVGKNGAFVDGSTVKLIIPASNTAGFLEAPMSLTAMQDTYQGQIDIGGIKSGPSEFTVSAADVNGNIGTGSGTYVHDHGPIITFIQPTKPTAHGSMYLQVEVLDLLHPVTDPSKVKATVRSGDNIVLTAVGNVMPLRMQGTIDFNSYSPALDGDQLVTVTATNDHGTTGRGVKQFTVDNSGPEISFVNPLPADFIGGVLQIKADIIDVSGVADGSVIAVFGGDLTKSVPLVRTTGDRFEGLFDVRQLGTNYVLPTLSVRADDLLGLHSEVAEEIVVDNTPPMMSLDPQDVYITTRLAGDVVHCSQPFDPVGGDAASDLDPVLQVVTLRARVEDKGNFAQGLKVIRFSGIADGSVFLYGIPAANGALAVDTDGDGICDDVNPELVPTTNVTASNQAVAVQMAPIPPNMVAQDVRPSPTPQPLQPQCTEIGGATGVKPPPLCSAFDGLDLTVAISYGADKLPAIWTLPPVRSNSTDCVGLQFDSLNRMPEGPACFVVVARDKAGNHSVSPPLRVCIDRGGGLCGAGVWPGASPPRCLGTYDKATMMTNSTPCTLPVTFPSPSPALEPIPDL
jgi:hypothetical protein